MGFSTRYISPNLIATRLIREIDSTNLGISFSQRNKAVFTLVKYLTGRRLSNISEISVEESDHETPQYTLRGTKGFITITLE